MAAGLLHPEMLSLAARAEARRGDAAGAQVFVAEIERCQPPVGTQRKRQLAAEIERLLQEHGQAEGADGS